MTEEERNKLREECSAQRSASTDAIVNSTAAKKVVVAGPGTGKTALFESILKRKNGNCLTLSFINVLVDDLALRLCGLTEVTTLHGYALRELQKKNEQTKVFIKLPSVISEDHVVLCGAEANFKPIFENGEQIPALYDFYKARKDYYGPYYGFADIIYALSKYFQQKPGAAPKYEQVLIDEFQDFNRVEVELVEQLAAKSPVLLAGDDDQALYVSMKFASPDHIRARFHDRKYGYECHTLPFCSRSAEVIIQAVNNLIERACKEGLLKNRIDKPFRYFADVSKDEVSTENPKIDYVDKFDGMIPWFIEQQLKTAAARERKKFDVLVIVPPKLKNTAIPKIEKGLRKKGFKNIISPEISDGSTATLRDGLRLLLVNKMDNLGWRIVAKALLSDEKFSLALKASVGSTKSFVDLVPNDTASAIRGILKQLKKLKGHTAGEVTDDAIEEILKHLKYDTRSEKLAWLETQFEESHASGLRPLKEIPIAVTTISGSKGLAADYVFISHFDDNYFTKDGHPTDDHIFSLVVALTRARKKAFLISTKQQEPQLLSWLGGGTVNRI